MPAKKSLVINNPGSKKVPFTVSDNNGQITHHNFKTYYKG